MVVGFDDFRLETKRRRLVRGEEVIALPGKAIDMLIALVERRGAVVTKDELLTRLWPDSVVEEANLTVNMSALRKALGESAGDHRYIATVAGVGYKFVATVTEIVPPADSGTAEISPVVSGTSPAPTPRRPLRPLRWAAVVLLIVAGVASFQYFSARSETVSSRRVVPLISLPGMKALPSFSPDGHQMAFVWYGNQSDNADIYVRQIETEGLLRLTTHAGSDLAPSWSPDGRYIAFLRLDAGVGGLYVVPALGGSERKVASIHPGKFLETIAWSRDGQHIAVSDLAETGARAIYLIDVASGRRRPATPAPAATWKDTSPAFSPDGKQLAFIRGTDQFVGDIVIASVSGGEPTRVTFDNRFVAGFAWTPDGREIVFSSNRAGLQSLWRVSLPGGTPEPLPTGVDDAMFPALSANGRHLAYARWKSDSNIWRVPGPAAPDVDAAPLRLIASSRDDALPHISPDGERVVFLSTRTGSDEIWVSARDGTNAVQLTSFRGASGGTPRWSPDGRAIVFDWRRDGHADIFTLIVDGGALRRLTTEPSNDVVPSWSRDGRWVYFASDRNGGSQVWKVPSQGGDAVPVTKRGGFEAHETPDGSSLYYQKAGAIWRVPVRGGEETRVVEGVDWGFWATTRDGICYLNRRGTPHDAIECLDAATNKTWIVMSVEKGLSIPGPPGFAVSPDERWILFKRADHADHDIMLVENYR